MENNEFIEKYLCRIEFNDEVAVNIETLSKLQYHHLRYVPFENLDIFEGRKINLDIPTLFEKIVINHRGGICYELNGLFGELLKRIGFHVTYLSAKMPGYNNKFDHLLLKVSVNEANWIIDVGSDGVLLEPLKLEPGTILNTPSGIYQIDVDDKEHKLLKEHNFDFELEYTFYLTERKLEDFNERLTFFETSMDSHFKKKKSCAVQTAKKRISLKENRLLIIENGNENFTPISSEEFKDLLESVFNMKL